MHKVFRSALLLIAASIAASVMNYCTKKSETLSIEFSSKDYRNVRFDDAFYVELHQDSAKKIQIQGTESQLSKIQIKYTKNSIEIGTKDRLRFLRNNEELVRISLFFPETDTLEFFTDSELNIPEAYSTNSLTLLFWGLTGTCRAALDTDKLFLYANCITGNFYFEGKTRRVTLVMRKNSIANAENLFARFGVVYQHSYSDCRINAWERVIVDIYSSGNVYNSVKPEIIELRRFGEGEFIYPQP